MAVVITLLDDVALTLERLDDLGGDGGGHAHAVAGAGERRHPAERERELADRVDLHRDRIGGAAHAASFHLHLRLHVLDGLRDDLQRIGDDGLLVALALLELGGILLDRFLDLLHRTVHDALGRGLLAVLHDHADDVRDQLGVELGIDGYPLLNLLCAS